MKNANKNNLKAVVDALVDNDNYRVVAASGYDMLDPIVDEQGNNWRNIKDNGKRAFIVHNCNDTNEAVKLLNNNFSTVGKEEKPVTHIHTWILDGRPAPWSTLIHLQDIKAISSAIYYKTLRRDSGLRLPGYLSCARSRTLSMFQIVMKNIIYEGCVEPLPEYKEDGVEITKEWQDRQREKTIQYSKKLKEAWLSSMDGQVLKYDDNAPMPNME